MSDIIKIYTLPKCNKCKEAKEYFKSKELRYMEIDMSKGGDKETIARKKQFKSLGIKTYPVIIIGSEGEGSFIYPGFDKKSLDSVLES